MILSLIHIYTENGGFASEQGAQLADLSLDGGIFWSWKEEEKEIRMDTGYLRMRIARGTGSISYERADGSLLLAERDRESKCVEAFDSYRMVVNENTQIEEIQTPDAVSYTHLIPIGTPPILQDSCPVWGM